MQRIVAAFPRLVWLNPEPREHWQYNPSVQITRELIAERMFPLTLAGLDAAIRELKRPLGRSALHIPHLNGQPDGPAPAAT
jgi:uncharacterized protein with von Willebrand factor type A (vWA) domain